MIKFGDINEWFEKQAYIAQITYHGPLESAEVANIIAAQALKTLTTQLSDQTLLHDSFIISYIIYRPVRDLLNSLGLPWLNI